METNKQLIERVIRKTGDEQGLSIMPQGATFAFIYSCIAAIDAEQSQKYVKLQLTQAGIVAESKATITQLEEALSHATGGQYAQWQLDKADTQGKLIAKQLKIAEQSAEIERLRASLPAPAHLSGCNTLQDWRFAAMYFENQWKMCSSDFNSVAGKKNKTIAQQSALIEQQNKAYEAQDEECNRHCDTIQALQGDVAAFKELIEKCESALLIERTLYREDNPDGEPDHIYEALAAIEAYKNLRKS